MKKILIISPHFYPESFKCNDVAFELVKRGYNVTALSDIPNYPGGKFFKGYNLFKRRKEIVNGVKIIRTAVIPRGNGSGKMLALNYLSFVITASIRALFIAIFKNYDAILVHETSPITVGIPAIIIKKIRKRTKLLFWVLDLWPESLQVAGGVNNKGVLNFFERIAKMCYNNSDTILISSNGFKNSICEKGNYLDKLVYFPNWAEDSLTTLKEYNFPKIPTNGFNVMFAGNIGEAQDFENVMLAAKILHDEQRYNIHFILVGDGRKKSWVEQYIIDNALQDTVFCVGRHPIETMGLFFEKADVLFFSLKDSPIFNLTCPAKLQAYMSAGKPVLAMLNGEGANIVNEAKCGKTVNAGNSGVLAETIQEMSLMSKTHLLEMGINGKEYCKKNFSFTSNMETLEQLLTQE